MMLGEASAESIGLIQTCDWNPVHGTDIVRVCAAKAFWIKGYFMRLTGPLYEGDSILRKGRNTDLEPETAPNESDFTPDLVHRTIPPGTDVFKLNHWEIEGRARALRAQMLAAYARQFWRWLGKRFEQARQRREEEHLARAQNVAELEGRLRKLEREGRLLHV
jgi:hypothetical protein